MSDINVVNLDCELADPEKEDAPLVARPIVYPLRMNGVLGVGSVVAPCFQDDETVRVVIYTQDAFNPMEFSNSTAFVSIELKDCLGTVEKFEHVAADVVKVDEDEVYVLQAAFCQYVDLYLPAEEEDTINDLELAEEAVVQRSSRKRKGNENHDFMYMIHDKPHHSYHNVHQSLKP